MVYGYIYKIENLVNNKIYIGQSINIHNRKLTHFVLLRTNKHDNDYLQKSFNKYGESNFKFTVLNYATNKNTLDQLEIDYINHYNCLNKDSGYNLSSGGSNGKLSEETRKKLSEIRKGEKNPMFGMKGPLAPNYGKRGKDFHWYGRKHSEETKEKISKANKGKKRSLESRKKMSEGWRGRGLFGFTGNHLKKGINPEHRCWVSVISYNYHRKELGMYEDPLSAEIVRDLVFEEIYKGG